MAAAHPFAGTALVIEDTMRVMCIVLGLWITYALAMVWARGGPPSTASGAGILAVVLLAYSAVGTEILRLGHPVSAGGFWWRLPMNLCGLVAASIYLLRLRAVIAGRRPTDFPNPWEQ